jgi:hypothetical protein
MHPELTCIRWPKYLCIGCIASNLLLVLTSVVDPYVFGPPGSGSVSQRYGSVSFYHAKIVKKTLMPNVL